MTFCDGIAFRECLKRVSVALNNGDEVTLLIPFNISTRLYFETLAFLDNAQNENDDIAALKMAEITADLISNVYQVCSAEWVIKNLSHETQLALINQVLSFLVEEIKGESLNIPDIRVKRDAPNSKDKTAKKQTEKHRKISQLTKLLAKRIDGYLMDEIAFITTKTNNTISEIMDMPILFFKALSRSVRLNELRSDDDYNLAYLTHIAEKYRDEIGKSIEEKPEAPKRDISANLKAMIS